MQYFEEHQSFPSEVDWEEKNCMPNNPVHWTQQEEEVILQENKSDEPLSNLEGLLHETPQIVPLKIHSAFTAIPLLLSPLILLLLVVKLLIRILI
jgi:hypothetical protein